MTKPIILAALLAGVTALPAHAATLYSSRTTFNAAGAGTSTFTTIDGSIASQTFAPFTVGSLAFTGNALYVTAANTSAGLNGAPNTSDWIQYQLNTAGGTVTIAAPAFRLIGFDVRPYVDNGGGSDVGETIRFTANTGETGTFVTPTTNVTGFLGIAFDTAVTSVTFAATNGGGNLFSWFGTDNYQLWSQAAAVVPEPATLAMLIGGFGVMGGSLRVRRRVHLAAA